MELRGFWCGTEGYSLKLHNFKTTSLFSYFYDEFFFFENLNLHRPAKEVEIWIKMHIRAMVLAAVIARVAPLFLEEFHTKILISMSHQ